MPNIDALKDWGSLNTALRRMTNEADAKQLLARERKGRRRLTFMLRIFSKYNQLRAHRERNELVGKMAN